MKAKTRKPAVERFWAKVIAQGNCLLFGKDGYGNFWDGRTQIGANRFSLSLKIGRPLTRSEFACHTCDNPSCVNPDHLFLGSAKLNSEDMVRKGRKEKGEDVGGAKLTEKDVIRIRALYKKGKTQKYIAKLFSVTPDNVGAVVKGKTWKHVAGPTFKTDMRILRNGGDNQPDYDLRRRRQL